MWNQTLFTSYPFLKWVILALGIIEIILKGFALYRSAKKDQKYWFIAILIINSVGILPLVYLLLNTIKKGKNKTAIKS